MSRKIRKWVIQYVTEHDKGNPVLRLDNLDLTKPPSLLEQVLEEEKRKFGQEKRLENFERLIKMLKENPTHPNEVARRFALETGHSAKTVEEYMGLLRIPVRLRRGRVKRAW